MKIADIYDSLCCMVSIKQTDKAMPAVAVSMKDWV